jgi:hypothetical protein
MPRIAIAFIALLFYNMGSFGRSCSALGCALFLLQIWRQHFKDKFAVENDIYALKDGAETNELFKIW